MPLATIQYQDEEGYIFDVYYDVDEEGEIIISEVSNEDGDVWTEDELDEDDPDLLEEILDYLEDMLDLDIEDLYSSSK
jgi:hypothetical protein|tara:strand:- start:336 stop:569 length:234 start_codon:yes stop_codon:yes gene_type:complete